MSNATTSQPNNSQVPQRQQSGSQQQKQQLEASLKRSRTLNVILGALAFFLAVVVVALMLGRPADTSTAAAPAATVPQQSATEETSAGANTNSEQAEIPEGGGAEGEFVRRLEGDPMAIGDVNAPVVMSEWLDFRCPYCTLFATETLPTLIEEYVDEGLLLIEFNDVAYFGEQSFEGAVAARAAGAQGLYFEYMKAIYGTSEGDTHPDLTRELLLDLAKQIEVPDLAKFEADFDSAEMRQAVTDSNAYAQSIGVSSVPFFAIGEGYMAGAQPLEAFRGFIDQALGK